MALPAFVASGAAVMGSTSLALPYPTALAAGMLLIAAIGNKYPPNGPATRRGLRHRIRDRVHEDPRRHGDRERDLQHRQRQFNRGPHIRLSKSSDTDWEIRATDGSDDTAPIPERKAPCERQHVGLNVSLSAQETRRIYLGVNTNGTGTSSLSPIFKTRSPSRSL
jgi:hypothetical protein